MIQSCTIHFAFYDYWTIGIQIPKKLFPEVQNLLIIADPPMNECISLLGKRKNSDKSKTKQETEKTDNERWL